MRKTRRTQNRLLGLFPVLWCGVGPLADDAHAQSGHGLRANAVVVESESHWNNWSFPAGTLEIDANGVRPRLWRRHTNAVLDIVDNLRFNPPDYLNKKSPDEIELLDAVDAGSNKAAVANLFDGDMTTYWEPEFPAAVTAETLDQHGWFAVDLGHSLTGTRIVLRFVDEGLGDPFRLFEVMVSDGQKPVKALLGDALDYTRTYQTLHPNLGERVIEIDLANLPIAERRKRIVRLVQVVVTGSALARGREISRDEYERLRTEASQDTGMVEYSKSLESGGELAVTRELYYELEEDRRGPIRYFRRELPRLAELEVWSEGDDIFKETLSRGGHFSHTTPHILGAAELNPQLLLDGQIETYQAFPMAASGLPDASFLVDLVVDLGSFFWIEAERIVLNFRPSIFAFKFGELALDFSDGAREVDGSLKWDRRAFTPGIPRRTSSTGSVHLYAFDFEPVKARFLRMQYRRAGSNSSYPAGTTTAYVGEIQLHGRGYQPQVELTSDLIQLGGNRNLSTIEWVADTPPGTRVELQTRTGNTLDTLLHYYKADGTEISEAQYKKIRIKSQKGPIEPEEVAGSDWEPWSAPYEIASGSQITSPSPRKLLKIRATLHSDDPDVHATLREVRLNFSEPVADRLLGRLVPTRVDSPGVEHAFSLFVDLESQANPFDKLLLRAPAGMQLAFDPSREHVFAGPASAFGDRADPKADGPTDRTVGDVQVLTTGDSLQLSFATVTSGVEVVRVDFRGTLFSSGGRLQALMHNSDDGVWQRVDEEVARTSLQLVAQPQRKVLFGSLELNPPAFSPNGDGLNDVVKFNFTLMLVGISAPVEVEIFDLTGRRLRRLEEQRPISAGTYSIAWDGRDEAGVVVPPGLYAARVRLDSDTEGASIVSRDVLGAVAVIY